jgi:hypothetical protein
MTTTIDKNHKKATVRMHKPRKWDGAALFAECSAQRTQPSFGENGKFEGYRSLKSKRLVKSTLLPKDVSVSLFTAYRNAETKAKTPAKATAKPESKKVVAKAEKPKTDDKRHRIDVTKKIHLKVTENPKRKESASYKVFALYKEGMTVEEFLKLEKKGAHLGHVRWDVEHGFIELV